MPVYNGERFLRRTLDSLLAQDYENFELIISDNASQDNTRGICLEYAARDKRIRYCPNDTNLGMRRNFNRAFQLSSGEYFMWAGDHDLWDRSFISTCLEVLTRDPHVVLCCGHTVAIDGDGKVLGSEPHPVDTRRLPPPERFRRVIRDMAWYTPIYGLIRADALRRTHLFRNTRGPDIVVLCELSLIGEFHCVPKVLFWYNWFPDEEHRRRTLRQFLPVFDPDNRRKPLIMLFPTCTMVYHLLSVVKNSNLRLAVKAKLRHDVVRLCSARWRDAIAGELGVRWLLQAIRFARRLLGRGRPYARAT
jgi:glycosyltransferase involved in cell wall biosynthesis